MNVLRIRILNKVSVQFSKIRKKKKISIRHYNIFSINHVVREKMFFLVVYVSYFKINLKS